MNKEEASIVQESTKNILQVIEGTPILREELVETPNRVVRAYEELFDGYHIDIPELFRTFEEGDDQLVLSKDIPFISWCEHHVLPFIGTVSVAYLPKKNRVIGASKIPRLVSAYAHRLQIQERLARQIADDMMKYLEPHGVAVIIKAKHSCIAYRGIKSEGTELVNSIMLGAFRESSELRNELLLLGLKA